MLEFRELDAHERSGFREPLTNDTTNPPIIFTGNPIPGVEIKVETLQLPNSGGMAWIWSRQWSERYGGGWGSEQPVPNDPPIEVLEEAAIDALAQHVAKIIKAMPDYMTREYGVVIYRNADGEIVASAVVAGSGEQVDLRPIMPQVGLQNFIAIIHSHPEIQSLNGQPNPFDHMLSTGVLENLKWLQSYGDQDSDRGMYLIHDNQVDEYLVSLNQNINSSDMFNSNSYLSETFII